MPHRHERGLFSKYTNAVAPLGATALVKNYDYTDLVTCSGVHWWVVLCVLRQRVHRDASLWIAGLGDFAVPYIDCDVVNTRGRSVIGPEHQVTSLQVVQRYVGFCPAVLGSRGTWQIPT